MGLFTTTQKLNWVALESEQQLQELLSSSESALIFKHSTRCGISRSVLSQFERELEEKEGFTLYFLDLLNFRNLSDSIAEKTNVRHESPQVLLIQDGKIRYQASHESINAHYINSLNHE